MNKIQAGEMKSIQDAVMNVSSTKASVDLVPQRTPKCSYIDDSQYQGVAISTIYIILLKLNSIEF